MPRTKHSNQDSPTTLIQNPRPGSNSNKVTRTRHRKPNNPTPGTERPEPFVPNDYRARLFIYEYIKDCNKTQAAIRAGYSADSASGIGHQLSRKYEKKIDKLLEEKFHKIEFDAESLAQELAKIAKVNSQDLFDEDGVFIPIHELPRHVAAAIQSFEVVTEKVGRGEDATEYIIRKVRLWNKQASIETLMKYLGVLIEKKEVTGKDGKDLIPEVITHTFEISKLSEQQLDALVLLANGKEPVKLIPIE